MDWRKAKNILIAMFLIINILLSYQLITINRNQYKYTDKQELENVIQYLKGKNVQVQAEVPDRVYVLPSIRVKYYEFNPQKIKDTFFSAEGVKQSENVQGFSISDNNIEVKVNHGYNVKYINNALSIKNGSIDESKCLNIVNDFVDKLKLNNKGKYIKEKDIESGYMRLVLGQKFNNIPVENSQIEVIATDDGVVKADINWFEWIKADNDKRYKIITPVMAMLKAFEDSEAKEGLEIIKEIRQGYYFNPDRIDGIDAASVNEGTVSPIWIIVTDKKEIYVNAYTEKIEMIK